MEWPVIPYSIEPVAAAAIIVVLVLAVIILILTLWHRKIRQRKHPLWAIRGYRKSYPAFFQVLADFQSRHDTRELFQDPEAKKALEQLQFHARSGRPARRVQAAMTTILRAIYLNREFRQDLSPQSLADIDRFLDLLTTK
ncbi:MAG: hypothetical protein ACRD1R_04190 [Acidobacteriota bacterium]